MFPTPLTRHSYSLQSRFARSVTVGIRQEYGFHVALNQLFDHHLCDTIAHRGHPQNPLAPILLGNGNSAYRWRKVASRTHTIPDLEEIPLQVCLELFKRLPIHARCALIGFDRL